VSRTISVPIAKLEKAAAEIGRGELDDKIKIKTGDEIELLADSFNKMADNLKLTTVSRDYVENIFASMIDSLVVVTSDGKIITVNKATCALLGYEEKELVGKNVSLLLPEENEGIPFVGTKFDKLTEKESLRNCEMDYRAKDGKKIPMLFNISVLRNEKGNVINTVYVARDVTEQRKRVEKRRKQQEKFLQSVFGSLTSPFYIINANDYTVEMANSAAGFGNLSKASKCHALTHGMKEPCQGEHICPLEEVKKTKKPVTVEHKHYDAEGNIIYVEINGFPILDASGNVARMIEYVLDITDRKKAEEKLKYLNKDLSAKKEELLQRQKELIRGRESAVQLSKQAQAASKAKSEFLANISHEIRTPLNVILGFINLLKRTPLNGKQIRLAEAISSSGKHLGAVIKNVLDFEKSVSDKLVLEAVDFNLKSFLDEIFNALKPEATNKAIKLSYAVDSNIPDEFSGDVLRLKQILMNLISNAIKFTEKGFVRLDVAFDDTSENMGGDHGQNGRDRIRFVVTDTGIGIPLEKQKHVFEPFTQVDGSTTRKYGGTGLGLSICSALVKLMGGKIGVESQPGQGSRLIFTVLLQRIIDKEEVSGELQDVAKIKNIKDIKVLVADDEVTSRELVESCFDKLGCQYDFAFDGYEASEKIKNNNYDLCLMDIRMPKLNGIEATKIIREEINKKIPIIALSDTSFFQDKENCVEIGMNDFIAKPVKLNELRNKLMMYAKKISG